MNPAIVAPEAFDVIDVAISVTQRKNLGEIAKTLHQISLNRGSGLTDSDYNVQLNTYIKFSGKRFASFLKEALTVVSAEEYFNMDEFVELSRQDKPIIYISPDEVIQVHHNLVANIDNLTTLKDDPLRIILNDLGAVPTPDIGAKGPGSEISLALTNRFAKIEDESEMKLRLLINETKLLILAVIRINVGKSLLEILEAPSTEQHEAAFAAYIEQEAARGTRPSTISIAQKGVASSDGALNSSPLPNFATTPEAHAPTFTNMMNLLKNEDGSTMTFSQLKINALENMAKIEAAGQAFKADGYQKMLNSIVEDMLNKQRQRAQRRREFQSLQATLINLDEKAEFLADQNKSYHDYIDACMTQLSNKKGKTKKAPLFSKQYYHMRDLKKEGKVPQFGSFKYSAAELHKKGVLVSIDDYSPKHVEVSFLGVKLPEKMELRLEDLLQNQYNKVDVVTLFDMAKVNLNLLIFLINKNPVQHLRDEWSRLKAAATQLERVDGRKQWVKHADNLDRAVSDGRTDLVFAAARAMSGNSSRSAAVTPLYNSDGIVQYDPTSIMRVMQGHYESLAADTTAALYMPANTQEGVPPTPFARALLRVCGQVFASATIPRAWLCASIVSIDKKDGDPLNPGDKRGIALINVGLKLVCKVLQNAH
ncbi:hypothetical protein BASA83_011747 [Batrachochytrium salamandrivorans]|nr:hypothetical protein BASA83_011747 [Batrachochytrium salamandrivorans]